MENPFVNGWWLGVPLFQETTILWEKYGKIEKNTCFTILCNLGDSYNPLVGIWGGAKLGESVHISWAKLSVSERLWRVVVFFFHKVGVYFSVHGYTTSRTPLYLSFSCIICHFSSCKNGSLVEIRVVCRPGNMIPCGQFGAATTDHVYIIYGGVP